MSLKPMSLFITLGGLLATPFIVMGVLKPSARVAVEPARGQTPQAIEQLDHGLDIQRAAAVQRDLERSRQAEQIKIDTLDKQLE